MRLFLCRFPAVGGLLLLAVLCTALLGANSVQAAILIVTTTADNGAGSLRAAISAASNGDTIQFDPALNGQVIMLTSGELLINENIIIHGPGPDLLAVSRASAPAFRIFHIMPGHAVMIKGLTISGGSAEGNGHGVLNDQSTLTIDNCSVRNNGGSFSSGGNGGGIYNFDGSLAITNSTIADNFAYSFGGFGNGGGVYNSGTLEIVNSTISDNIATVNGGGIYSYGPLTITDSIVTRNYAGNTQGAGGGIASYDSLIINRCTLSSNSAPATHDGIGYGYGGAIASEGTLAVVSSTLSDNGATSSGGGIASYGNGTAVTISNSTLSGNSAWYTSGSRGGAIASNGTLEITYSTLHGNSAGTGGGVYNYATFRLRSTILDANAGSNIFNDSGTVTSLGYNLSSDSGSGFLTATGDQINTNPILGPLQDNGGLTLTHALLTGSPAINTGDPNFTPPPLYDQRGPGYPRVFSGRIDIGSFELQPIGTMRIVTTTDDSGIGSLRDVIATAQAGDTIQFDATLNGQTITLTSGELAVDKSVIIAGPGAGLLMVQRSTMANTPDFRVFEILPGRAVTIQGLTISNGHPPGGNPSEPGGGIYNNSGTLTLSDCTLMDNRADQAGGGIYNTGTLTMSDCTLIRNRADEVGGGIANRSYGGILTMNNCTVSTNSAGNGGLGGYGGGVFSGGVMTITNCTFRGNTTTGGARGGGIYNAGTSTVSNSTVSGNLGSYGGGIYNDGGITMLEVTNCTVSANTAYSRGGGLYNGDGRLILTHSTLSGNVANSSGGGVYNQGSPFHVTVEIGNNIFNAGATGANIVNAAGTVTSHGYNLSSDNGGGVLNSTGDLINTDPMLGPLQDNGGPTFTHELLNGSPALNAGDPNFTPPPLTDQRGFPRVYNGRIDIGSVELQSGPPPTPTPSTAQLQNISTRVRVETGDNVMIGGFIINGAGSLQVVIRGIGPSLGQQGISDFLPDPILELRDSSGSLLVTNDNWQDDPTQATQLLKLGLAPGNPAESALLRSLQPGAYTAIIAGTNGGTGVGLVEVYNVDHSVPVANIQLANISTRGFVQTGDNVMIGGFILGGNGSSNNARIAIRGIGPSLTQFGVPNALADPTLELRDGNGMLLVANDNWQDDPASAAQLIAHGLAPPNLLESGIFASLPPGAFTAILAGKNGGTGIGLVEVYHLQ